MTDEISVATPTPRVLTRNIIPTLTEGLDASDVVECYALVRSAQLHGIANATIHIQKMAIGVRYRPPGALEALHVKEKIELTLEYGPQRMGPSLNHDATPFIQVEESSSFLTWENVGKVYYTTRIVSGNYLSSYYMASMTGAVLNKILVQAVDYAERRRRYQPFSVYSPENGKVIRSSSSADFTQYMWEHLARLGVEIEPILPPPLYEARLWVTSWKKVIPEPYMAHQAATFYQKVYKCLESIATNDYRAFMPTLSPTISPAPTQKPIPTPQPSHATPHTYGEGNLEPTGPDDFTSTNSTTNPPTDENDSEGDYPPVEDNENNTDGVQTGTSESSEGDTKSINNTYDGGNRQGDGLGRFLYRRVDSQYDEVDYDDLYLDEGDDADVDDNVGDGNLVDDTVVDKKDENPPQSQAQDVEKAQQAAQEAQIAADEAKSAAKTEGETKAADAAQAAASAAQAAADATSNAAAQAAMEGLLSGEGTLMSSIVTTCFTNQQYGIASTDENGTMLVEAFLYRDGFLYYKLNLTSPYLEIAKINRPLPKAIHLSDVGSGGDLTDWALALLVLACIILMFVAILQQMGHEYIQSLFRCQRWFFNPRKYDYEGNAVFENGQESLVVFGEDAIPLSMGGRLTTVSPIIGRRSRTTVETNFSDKPELRMPQLGHTLSQASTLGSLDAAFGDVELPRIRSIRRMSIGSMGSLSEDEIEEISSVGVPERLVRDPDLVDLPSLKSTSKVAVPVGTNGNNL